MAHQLTDYGSQSINILPKRGKVEFFSKILGSQYGIKEAAFGKFTSINLISAMSAIRLKGQCKKTVGNLCQSSEKNTHFTKAWSKTEHFKQC